MSTGMTASKSRYWICIGGLIKIVLDGIYVDLESISLCPFA